MNIGCIALVTNYIIEYADNRDELSAEKTAEVIYDLVLSETRGLNCPFAGRKIFCLEERCTGCYWYDRTLEQSTKEDKVIADNMRDFWNHSGVAD